MGFLGRKMTKTCQLCCDHLTYLVSVFAVVSGNFPIRATKYGLYDTSYLLMCCGIYPICHCHVLIHIPVITCPFSIEVAWSIESCLKTPVRSIVYDICRDTFHGSWVLVAQKWVHKGGDLGQQGRTRGCDPLSCSSILYVVCVHLPKTFATTPFHAWKSVHVLSCKVRDSWSTFQLLIDSRCAVMKESLPWRWWRSFPKLPPHIFDIKFIARVRSRLGRCISAKCLFYLLGIWRRVLRKWWIKSRCISSFVGKYGIFWGYWTVPHIGSFNTYAPLFNTLQHWRQNTDRNTDHSYFLSVKPAARGLHPPKDEWMETCRAVSHQQHQTGRVWNPSNHILLWG